MISDIAARLRRRRYKEVLCFGISNEPIGAWGHLAKHVIVNTWMRESVQN
jgi:hypothetical protein